MYSCGSVNQQRFPFNSEFSKLSLCNHDCSSVVAVLETGWHSNPLTFPPPLSSEGDIPQSTPPYPFAYTQLAPSFWWIPLNIFNTRTYLITPTSTKLIMKFHPSRISTRLLRLLRLQVYLKYKAEQQRTSSCKEAGN